MKAKLFILTYNNEEHINATLGSLFSSDLSQHQVEVFVVNNHTNFKVREEFTNKITVLHNVMQPDFGTGHSTRNWNQMLILGFKNLNAPDCDLVILAQDDCHFFPNWLNLLHDAHFNKGLHFVSVGVGDMLHSYTPTAIKKIGLWDERFAALCFAEHDYFIRAAMHLGLHASVNDTGHAPGLYSFNELPYANQIAQNPPQNYEKASLGPIRAKFDNPFRELFKAKWGNYSEHVQTFRFINNPIRPGIPHYITYPYFEKDVEDLNELNYNLGSGWSRQ